MTQAMRVFRSTVQAYYRLHGRHELPWRQPLDDGSFDPYCVMVSELMLQQTQVGRVIPKYLSFLVRFPDVTSLAQAHLSDVLQAWQGLGYNRRAKFLWQAARQVDASPLGAFPDTVPKLMELPGVGANTAGAIAAYAYDLPVTFVETNVRTVFIHHFFNDGKDVTDRQLLPLIQESLPARPQPGDIRVWYWALMDYGTHLKQTVGNISRQSSTYKKQSAFVGSRRAVRGQVLRLLVTGPLPVSRLEVMIADARLPEVLDDLGREALISRHDNTVSLHEG